MNTAVVIAAARFGKLSEDAYKPVKLVGELFEDRGNLLGIYFKLLDYSVTPVGDVRICPASTFVPLYREKVFLMIKPAIKSGIELGAALVDYPPSDILKDTGGLKKKDRITRKIELFSEGDINDFVKALIKTAYEMS